MVMVVAVVLVVGGVVSLVLKLTNCCWLLFWCWWISQDDQIDQFSLKFFFVSQNILSH